MEVDGGGKHPRRQRLKVEEVGVKARYHNVEDQEQTKVAAKVTSHNVEDRDWRRRMSSHQYSGRHTAHQARHHSGVSQLRTSE